MREMQSPQLSMVRDQNRNEQVWLSALDVVVGMYTTVLMKARFYSKPAISFQPALWRTSS